MRNVFTYGHLQIPAFLSPLLYLAACGLAQTTAPVVQKTAPVLQTTAPVVQTPAQVALARVTSSLVVVKFTWDSEFGKRELIGSGVVVDDTGLIMTPLAMFDPRLPDEQIKDVKLILPRIASDHEELDATFVGRDERTETAFVRVSKPELHTWTPLKFEDVEPVTGQTVYSVGLMPKEAGYKVYCYTTTVAATLRGETPQVLVSAFLTSVGSVVLDEQGRALGMVNAQGQVPTFLYDSRAESRKDRPYDPLAIIRNPPQMFTPSRDFLLSLSDPPKAGEPLKLTWIGVPSLRGLNKDEAEFFGLTGQPVVEIGDIIPSAPADKAGLKAKQIITKINGQPLERGDQPEELPGILRRQLLRGKVGDVVTLTILPARNEPTVDVKVVLEEQPARANLAKRFHAEDLGFSVRDLVFADTYSRRLPVDQKGVVVAFVKLQGSASSAKLMGNDLITDMNGAPVESVEQLRTTYEAFRKDTPREAVVLVVIRDASTQTVRIEPPQ